MKIISKWCAVMLFTSWCTSVPAKDLADDMSIIAENIGVIQSSAQITDIYQRLKT
ncbi:hypothetical protein [Citrobacter braakii]|uniref:hypothetical protein n=1 Tax=Citrobacter braakii TaxID=57706 RepID=UPI00351D6EC0